MKGERPSSFTDALDGYESENALAFEGCVDETDILNTYQTVSVAKLAELTSGTDSTSMKYAAVLNNDVGRSFMTDVGSPELVRGFAVFQNPEPASSSDTGSSNTRDVRSGDPYPTSYSHIYDCVPDMDPNENTPLEMRMEALNCVYKAPIGFWKENRHDDLIEEDKEDWWLYSANDRCSASLDVVFYACDKHDIAYETLQRMVPGNSGDDMDEAWNPRNKLLADLIFKDEIAEQGCDWIDENFPAHENFCATYGKEQMANFYFFGVSEINTNRWPFTQYDFADTFKRDADEHRYFTICHPPTIDTVNYGYDGWNFTATWELENFCVDDLKVGEYKFDWTFKDTDDAVLTGNRTSDDKTHTIWVRHGWREDLEAAYFSDFQIEATKPLTLGGEIPNNFLSSLTAPWIARLPDGYRLGEVLLLALVDAAFGQEKSGYYKVDQSKMSDEMDTRLLLIEIRASSVNWPFFWVRDTVTLTPVIHTTLPANSITYTWREKKNGQWVALPDSELSGNNAVVIKNTPGTREFRVSVSATVTENRPSGSKGSRTVASSTSLEATSDQVDIEWMPSDAATPTPTATSTATSTPGPGSSHGLLSVSRSIVQTNKGFAVNANYSLTAGKTARISFDSRLSTGSSCTNTSGTIDLVGTSGYSIRTLYGCAAGSAVVKLLEMPGSTELDSVTITVTNTAVVTETHTPTPTPTDTPEPAVPSTAEITATRTTLEVGQSTVVTFDFDLQGSDEAEIIIPSILGGSECRAGRQARAPQQLQGTYYGCSAGTGDIEIRLTNSPYTVLASLTLVVTQPPTHTPTPTKTPTPTNTPLPPCSGSVTVSDSSIEVRERVDVDASYSGDCPSGASLEWSRQLSTSSRCGPDVPRTANTDLSRRLYGCVTGTGTVWLIDDSNNDTLDSVRVTVRARPTATPTPTNTPLPPCSGSVTVSDSSIEVRERVDVDASYSGDCPAGASLEWSNHLSTSSRCGPDVPRSATTDISRRLYGCIAGTGTVWLIDDSNNDTLDSATVYVSNRPTVTPTNTPVPTDTPTPTATPEPTGSLSSNKSSVEIRESFTVRGRYNIPGGTYTLSISSHFHTRATCTIPRSEEAMRDVEVDTRGIGEFWRTLYGCREGTGTITLNKANTNIELHSIEVEVTLPEVPRPTGVNYVAGDNWLLFRWTAPSGGWDTFETRLGSGSWEDTTNGYKRYNSLISGASYVFRVRTKASDGRTSNTVVTYADTICSDCSRGARYEMALESFGDGAHLVGDDIAAGVYNMGEGTEECIWGRVDDSGTVYEQIIEEGGLNADRTVHIRETDHGFYTFGCGIWTKQ